MDQNAEQQEPTPDRIKALRQSMAGLYAESIAVTGLPPDMLYTQVAIHASVRGLPANGRMAQLGPGSTFIPDKDTLKAWLEDYFGELQRQQAADESGGMAEA